MQLKKELLPKVPASFTDDVVGPFFIQTGCKDTPLAFDLLFIRRIPILHQCIYGTHADLTERNGALRIRFTPNPNCRCGVGESAPQR
ncbi:MAG: hypothetical protein ALMCE001_08980 [Methanocorpusculum sp. MCE]|nr:MAG: hypothetical protein ALMCE001_08980 [Methanocorpusculum sp. MCE]